MHIPRTFQSLRLWVLAWFMVSLGVAIAAPLVQPQPLQIVCSSTGTVMLMAQDDDGGMTKMGTSGMDCPLCSLASAPPPSPAAEPCLPAPLAHALQPTEAARIAAATAAPLSARAPPTLS